MGADLRLSSTASPQIPSPESFNLSQLGVLTS